MSEHMRTHHIKQIENIPISILINEAGDLYKIPVPFYEKLKKYEVKDREQKEKAYKKLVQLRWNKGVEPDKIFTAINSKYSKLGALVKGIRYKENLSQQEFAAKIDISQTDLSKIENGKRAIGKTVIGRIVKKFKVSQEVFLNY